LSHYRARLETLTRQALTGESLGEEDKAYNHADDDAHRDGDAG
jgi:hypothetical protein